MTSTNTASKKKYTASRSLVERYFCQALGTSANSCSTVALRVGLGFEAFLSRGTWLLGPSLIRGTGVRW